MHDQFARVMSLIAGLPEPVWIELWGSTYLPATVHYGRSTLEQLLARFGVELVFRPHAVMWAENDVEIWCSVPNGEHDALLSRLVEMGAE